MTKQTKKIGYILLFYIIAVSLRYYILFIKPDFFINANYFFTVLLEGIGPLFGGLLLVKVFKRPNKLRLFSIGYWQSLLLVLVPILLFFLLGIINTGKPYYSAFNIVGSAIIYGIFEEYGWRGYLQTELDFLKKGYKYLIIAVLWYVWHLDFGFTINHIMFFFFILLGTIGIGSVATKSKSLILVGLFHAFFNLFYLSNQFTGITLIQKIVIIGISVVLIIFMMKQDAIKNKKAV